MNFLLYMNEERGIRMSIKLENGETPRYIVSDGKRIRVYKSFAGLLGYFDGASLTEGKLRIEFANKTFAKTIAARAIYDTAIENPAAAYSEIGNLVSGNLRLNSDDSAIKTVLGILDDYQHNIPLVSERGFPLRVDDDAPVSTLML